jgi:hypothetical protein
VTPDMIQAKINIGELAAIRIFAEICLRGINGQSLILKMGCTKLNVTKDQLRGKKRERKLKLELKKLKQS